MTIPYIKTAESVTLTFNRRPYTIHKSAANYNMVLEALKNKDEVALRSALDTKSVIAEQSRGRIEVINGSIYFNTGTEKRQLHGVITDRILVALREGFDTAPMIKFLDNLMDNPSKRAVDEMYSFLEACDLPVTDDGHFLAYKRVRSDYRDVHSGTMDNSVGKVLEMARNAVDEDKNRTCSAGLHFCSYSYLAHFGGDRIMVLKINPRDVVAIPADYNNAKGRTCRYEVVDEIPVNDYKMPVKNLDSNYTTQYGSTDEDPDEDYSEENEEETVYYDLEGDEVDPWTVEDIIADYDDGNGLDVEDIVDEYRIGTETVVQILTDADVYVKTVVAPVAAVGTANVSAKLTEVDVRQIRNLLKQGHPLSSIAAQFNVSPRSIGRIRDGEAWTHVK